MGDELEKVGIAEEAADSIAERTAGLMTADLAEITKALATQGEALKGLLALANTPSERKAIEPNPGQPAPVPGALKISGGWDKYTGLSFADLALAKTIVEGTKRQRVSPRLAEVLRGKGEELLNAGPRSYADPWVDMTAKAFHADAVAKAMVSTTDAYGDDWVPTLFSSNLWGDIHLATQVTAAIGRVDMPSNPYQLPTQTADAAWKYKSTENVAVTATDLTTSAVTLTAKRLQCEIDFSDETTEDSIIPIVSTLRSMLVRKAAQTMDDLVVHGDTETGSTGNCNKDETAPAAGDYYLALDGMRKFAIVTNSGQASAVAAALSSAKFIAVKKLLGKYGIPSDLIAIMGPTTHNAILTTAELITPNLYGSAATILTGEVGKWFNVPVLLSEAIPLQSTDLVHTDGQYQNSTTGNNTKGWMVLANRRMWTAGFRRELTIEADKDIQKGQNILVASFRMALIPSDVSTTHTAIGINITV